MAEAGQLRVMDEESECGAAWAFISLPQGPSWGGPRGLFGTWVLVLVA